MAKKKRKPLEEEVPKVEEVSEEIKVEEVKEEKPVIGSSSMDKKAAAIMASKMPEEQKEKYLMQIGYTKAEEVKKGRISLAVWIEIRKKDSGMRAAYAAFPGAKNVRLATPSEWDEILKDF